MPLYIAEKKFDVEFVLWKIEETEDELLKKIPDSWQQKYIAEKGKNSENNVQRLAARVALNELLKNHSDIHLIYSESGKPFLSNENFHISLSHCKGFSAAIYSEKNCGIDIEIIDERIKKIEKKFVGEAEKMWIKNTEDLYLTWCAKETIFKMYSGGELDFIKHIYIAKPENNFSLTGKILKHGVEKKYQLGYKLLENNLVIVWGFEI